MKIQIHNLKQDIILLKNIITNLQTENTKLNNNLLNKINNNFCCICLSEESTYVNIECGHLCICFNCNLKIKNICPICRTTGSFKKIITV